MQIVDCVQGSPEWFQARLGIPTASEYATLLAQGRNGGISQSRKTYMLKLAGERITGTPMESYTNAQMERGKAMEAEARDCYAFATNADLTQVGFIRRGDMRTGCSPDALIGEHGVLEVKTALPHILIPHLLKGSFPEEHRAQCQGVLLVTNREWVDLVIYWPSMPMFRCRAYRDNGYIARLKGQIHQFNVELDDTVEQVNRYGSEQEHDPTLMQTLNKVAEQLEAQKKTAP